MELPIVLMRRQHLSGRFGHRWLNRSLSCAPPWCLILLKTFPFHAISASSLGRFTVSTIRTNRALESSDLQPTYSLQGDRPSKRTAEKLTPLGRLRWARRMRHSGCCQGCTPTQCYSCRLPPQVNACSYFPSRPVGMPPRNESLNGSGSS